MTQLELGAENGLEATGFTDEQRAAVEDRGRSVFLQAGAGSGKTRVLAERFVRAVCDDEVPVESILAITFTEKAAAELKERIRSRFVHLGEREHAREAEGAWISTIHGFCSRLLRSQALAAGLDPEYRVLDEVEAERVGVDAFDRALQDFLGQGESERLDLAAAYGTDRLDRMVRTVHGKLRSRGERAPRLPELPAPPPPGAARARLEAALGTAQRELGGADAAKPALAKALERLDACRAAFEALAPGHAGDPDEWEKLALKPGNTQALKTPVFEELYAAQGAWVQLCSAHKEYLDYGLLRQLLELYDVRYAELKEAASALDFEDLELRARDLLEEQAGLREQYRERFVHVMVDEYQDTNELQNSLLDLVARDNLFTVGDELQSIYLFRNADVGVFRTRREAAEQCGAVRRLTANFRTRRDVLDVLNPAFADVFGEAFQELRAGEPVDPASVSPSVELHVVDNKKARWDEAAEQRGLPDEGMFGFSMRRVPGWRAAEARLLAKRIDELTRGGPFEYGEVAVLMRAATDMAVYERALAERGLPTYAVGGRGYWGQQQTADLRAYLATVANPLDEMALYNVLATPLVGASLDALALVGLHAKRLKRDPWWALEQAVLPDGDGSGGLRDALPDGDRGRLTAFVARLHEERRLAGRVSLETLIDRAVTASGYDRAILAMPSGERRMANVRKLMRLAREYEESAGRDLRGFIDLLDEQDLMRAREGEAPLEAEGLSAIRLMTIHAAKGLEFPVVCVADLGRTGRGDDEGLQVTQDGQAGLRIASLAGGSSETSRLAAIRERLEREYEQEERRIFYVAMTRAEQHLVLSGATDIEKWPQPKPLEAPMTWVWRSVAPGLEEIAGGEGRGLLEHAHGGRKAGVACTVLSPGTADGLLGAEDRAPDPERARPDEPGPAARPAFVAVAAPAALPVARISYSALESYGRCGYRFYLERVLGLRDWKGPADTPPEPPGKAPPPERREPSGELPLIVRGSLVHQLLERVDFARPQVPGEGEVRERMEAIGARAGDEAVADLRAMVGGFIGSPLFARVAAARRVRTELPFAFPLGVGGQELLVNGVLDVHADESGGALVVDYKSDKLEGRAPEDVVEQDYATQRVVYALAVLRARAPRAEVAYLFLERPDEPVVAGYGPQDIPELERRLLELAGGVLEGRFEPTREPHRELCASCAGQPAMCSWEPEHTLAERPQVA